MQTKIQVECGFKPNFYFAQTAQVMGQPRAAEDLSMEIDVLFEQERDMKLLSLVNFLNSGLSTSNEKHEWQDDQMPPENFAFVRGGAGTDWDNVATITALPVATVQLAKLKIGDVIMLPLPAGAGEQVIVKAINTAGQTIDVYKRGSGGTTATAQGASGTGYIIGNAQVDGSDPMAGNYYAPTARFNYVQIFEDALSVSGKVMRSKVTRESERARQRALKLKRLISQLNFALLNGAIENSSGVATFNGLRNVASTTYNIAGALDIPKTYAMVIAMISAGGSPSAIHGSATGISRIEKLMSTFIAPSISDYNAKLTVNKIQMLGLTLELHIDKHMIDTEFLVLDYGRIRYGTMDSAEAKGAFSAVTITENLKQIQEQIAGYYTCEVKQPSAAIVKGYGCTS